MDEDYKNIIGREPPPFLEKTHSWLQSRLESMSSEYQFNDEYDIFGKHVAAQLRHVPLERFVVLQEKIQSIITTEILLCMEHQPKCSNIISHQIQHENTLKAENHLGESL